MSVSLPFISYLAQVAGQIISVIPLLSLLCGAVRGHDRRVAGLALALRVLVLGGLLMAPLAMRHPLALAPVVLSLRDSFKVCRIHTERVVTQVVDHQPFRDGADMQGVGVAVGSRSLANAVHAPLQRGVLVAHCALHVDGSVPAAVGVDADVLQQVRRRDRVQLDRHSSHVGSLTDISHREFSMRDISISKAQPISSYIAFYT